MAFFEALETAIAHHQSLLFVSLDPNPELLPDRFRKSGQDDLQGLYEWLLWVINQTAESVCAYKPTLGFYQALGAPGLELLQKVLQAIPQNIPVILDAKHGDLNTSTTLAHTVFEEWQVDAITLSPFTGQDSAAPFLVYPGKAVFVLCHTSNPGAIALQHHPNTTNPFYLQVVEEARNWGPTEQVGLEVGTTQPEVLAKIRAIAPERLILARSIWQEAASVNAIVTAGLNQNGNGLLIPIPQDWLSQENLAELMRSLKTEINAIRNQAQQGASSCELWTGNGSSSEQNSHVDLILQLFDVGCLLFGEFVQASGAVFPYYIDLRKIISNPQLFHQVLNAYAGILKTLQFDRIAGIPYGSLPTATGLALHLNYPMIYPRKEVKAHGTRRVVEGNFHPGETVVVVDDVFISGNSAIEGAGKLQSVGLEVKDIVVLLDHERGVKDRLRAHGFRGYSVLTMSEITKTLYQAGRIDAEQAKFLVEE
ncbi:MULTISPECIES: bifunctional orotidine-5'-phosphate decarboxylase/orotate phosphoribosyltransferase [unclassified Leptolyngbya]|uniref:bifunctional orotidine-5'-phosphate decarboxylase/orotate phosphoribosyltransferase n=1 Tax=unclassified Leptolyngbya TaxID=2650499 RepID=UPI0016857255|nr:MULTISPECIES: bifunctional orotidine-5'-phosphate decarboxylase/orotate phosphoribosyltransferase [unclassified Leptolyngbya]MBD1911717.1 bifunctional orotidine-5'-phosphate decarboxylase/orotate phosphoribosyltransferase [Leptolyngbya sp. FACHB-8]MBD2155552.1 bifunctional orotidine-5'-phosphate decarboxylase/orotate phosphoribosyltransferase [Leptolyngbya sp. FACHB-16]